MLVPQLIPPAHGRVVFTPRSPPCSPPPNSKVARKTITFFYGQFIKQIVGPRYHHYPLVVTIAIKHFFTKSEEIRVRQTVIFKNDYLFNLIKNPVQASGNSLLAPEVEIRHAGQHFARPVYTLDHRPCCLTPVNFTCHSRTRTISDNQQLWRLCSANGLENLVRRIRPIEDQKC